MIERTALQLAEGLDRTFVKGCDEANMLRQQHAEIERLTAERDAAIAHASALTQHLTRVIGDHNAPSDCYSSGPMFGDARDAVCPACAALRFLSYPRESACLEAIRARSTT